MFRLDNPYDGTRQIQYFKKVRMKKVLVSGCSFASGHGLRYEKNDDKLWVNQLFHDCSVTNIAVSGFNNHSIFIATAQELKRNDYDVVLVAWSAIPRVNINLGLELYSTMTRFSNQTIPIELNPHNTVPEKWVNSVGDQLMKYHNDHWDILHMIHYVNMLIDLAKNTKICFINSLGPWSAEYFTYNAFAYPASLSSYVQQILQVDSRDDSEICNLYNKIHTEYEGAGGIHEDCWLNLYQSLRSLQIDWVSQTDKHPGYLSQDIFVGYLRYKLSNFLKT